MKIKKSQYIKNGDMCKWHGDKLVRYLKAKGEPNGIWLSGHFQGIIKEDGDYAEFNIPTGLHVYGIVSIKS